MVKRLFLFLLLLALSVHGPAQIIRGPKPDTIHNSPQEFISTRFTILTNVVQDAINEYNLAAEYRKSPSYAFGISLGRVYFNPTFKVFALSPSQNRFPGTVYDGISVKLSAKKYSTKDPFNYWMFSLNYKHLWYNNVEFLDMYRGEHYFAYYWRTETANMFGFDVVRGRELSKNNKFIFSDIYIGVGLRLRIRNINTLKCEMGPNPSYTPDPPLGNSIVPQIYPMLVFGFRLGAGHSSN